MALCCGGLLVFLFGLSQIPFAFSGRALPPGDFVASALARPFLRMAVSYPLMPGMALGRSKGGRNGIMHGL